MIPEQVRRQIVRQDMVLIHQMELALFVRLEHIPLVEQVVVILVHQVTILVQVHQGAQLIVKPKAY